MAAALIALALLAALALAWRTFPLNAQPPRDAAAVEAECGADLHCVGARLSQVVAKVGTKEAMTLASDLAARTAYRDQGHVLAHEVGYATYREQPTLREQLSSCTDALGSGCLHGVMMLFIADDTNRDVDLAGVCKPFQGTGPHALYTDCVHGIGHGVLMREVTPRGSEAGWPEIERALNVCRRMQGDGSEAWFCAGGVFMEYRVAATLGSFHYPSPPRYRDGDPHWPCSEVTGQEAQACYAYQGSLIASWSPDLKAAFATCAGAGSPDLAHLCGSNIARDRVTGHLGVDQPAITALCAQADDPGMRQACFTDSAMYYVYLDRNLPGARAMCTLNGLPDPGRCRQEVDALARDEFGLEAEGVSAL